MEGKFFIHRKIFESDIWEKPAYYLKTWIWIIGKANWKTIKQGGKIYHRGEFLTNYGEIIEANKWTVGWRTEKLDKDRVFNVLDFLRKTQRITTKKATRGLWIKVLNYDYFQTLIKEEGNNESNNESNRPQTAGQQGKRKKEKKKRNIYKYLVLSYKEMVEEKTGKSLEMSKTNWAIATRRLKYLLSREEDPFTSERIRKLFNWFINSEKAKKYGFGITVALSDHTLNLFKQNYKDRSWQYAD